MKKSLFLGVLLLGTITLIGCQKSEPEISQIENPENDIILALEESEEENIDFILPEGAKTSLTFEELEEIAQTNFPTYSTYTIVDLQTEEIFTGENLYMEDTPHNLTNITPHFGTIVDQNLLSSGIEDGMIYSNFDVTFNDGTNANMLYINNPETLDFVAATVEIANEFSSINYQFTY